MLIAMWLVSCSATAEIDPALLEPTAVMPVFQGLDRTDADVCLDGSCRYRTVSEAVRNVFSGATIVVAPGVYPDCVNLRSLSVAIIGLKGPNGSRAVFSKACAGKGAFVSSAGQFLLKGVQVQDIGVRDLNGACVRLEGAGRTQRAAIIDVICANSENGVLANVGKGSLIVESSLFVNNGANNGKSHGIYVDGGAELFINFSVFHSAKEGGHSVKAGTKRLVVKSSILAALNSRNSRAIDYYGGGVLAVSDSVLQQGPNTDNEEAIAIGMEDRRLNSDSTHATSVTNSWIIYDDPGRYERLFLKGKKLGPVESRNNIFVAIKGTKLKPDLEVGAVRHKSRSAAGLPTYDATLKSLPRPKAWSR